MTSTRKAVRARKRPVQARSKQTVEWLLEATTRVFRAEGFDATTNRIARAAGVSVGTLYEYFPNKDALLYALASRHVETAETGIDAALASPASVSDWLAGLQSAVLASHRYPSEALQHVSDPRAPELRDRAARLSERVRAALLAKAEAAELPDADLRARTTFGLIAQLSSLTAFEIADDVERQRMLRYLWAVAVAQMEA